MIKNINLYDIILALIVEGCKKALSESQEAEQKKKKYPPRCNVTTASEITNLSRNTIYQMHHNGTIPGAQKIGGKLVFDTAVLEKWAAEGGNKVNGYEK